MIFLKFSIKISSCKIIQDSINETDKISVENLRPYFIFGFDNSIKHSYCSKITIYEDGKDKFKSSLNNELQGELRENYKKIPFDSNIISHLYIINKYEDVIEFNRCSENRIELRKIINDKQKKFELIYKNIEKEFVCSIVFIINEFKCDYEIEKENKNEIYTFEKKLIEKYTRNIVKNLADDQNELFKNYYENTDDIFVRCKIGFGPHKPINSFLKFEDYESNEEFWLNILKYVSIINLIENKYENLVKHENSNFDILFHDFVSNLDIKRRMNLVVDMFVIIAVNLIYNMDNVILKNGVKKQIEDFFNACEGGGDCEDFSRFILYSINTFIKTEFDNKTLNLIKKELRLYIPFLSLDAVLCASMGSMESSIEEINAHMNVMFVLKSYLFEGEKNEKNFGKIILNPFQNNTEILNNLKEIYEFEKEHGNLDSNDYPSILVGEGTGFFNPDGRDNPLHDLYSSFKKKMKKYKCLNQFFRTRFYHPLKKGYSPFYKNVFNLITNFFIENIKCPTDIQSLLVTYDTNVNNQKIDYLKDEDSYIYGCKYIDFANADENIRFVCSRKSDNLDVFIKIIKKIGRDEIKKIPLFKKNNEFKPRSLEKNNDFIPPTPNISNKVNKRLIKELNSMNINLNKGNYDEIFKLLTTENIIYYKVFSCSMFYILDDLKTFLKNEKYELVYIQKVDLTSVCSFFLLCFKLKE